jgi:hypothetical protein
MDGLAIRISEPRDLIATNTWNILAFGTCCVNEY